MNNDDVEWFFVCRQVKHFKTGKKMFLTDDEYSVYLNLERKHKLELIEETDE
jgi:hypothetical protein